MQKEVSQYMPPWKGGHEEAWSGEGTSYQQKPPSEGEQDVAFGPCHSCAARIQIEVGSPGYSYRARMDVPIHTVVRYQARLVWQGFMAVARLAWRTVGLGL